MKLKAASLLKLIIIIIVLFALGFFALVLPDELPEVIPLENMPVVLGVYLAALPFFYALFRAFKLLEHIENAKAFSEQSVRALEHIKYSAITIILIYLLQMPIFMLFAQEHDAPGVAAVWSIIILTTTLIAAFTTILQNILREGIDLKKTPKNT